MRINVQLTIKPCPLPTPINLGFPHHFSVNSAQSWMPIVPTVSNSHRHSMQKTAMIHKTNGDWRYGRRAKPNRSNRIGARFPQRRVSQSATDA